MKELINRTLGISEAYEMPNKLMSILTESKEGREKLFKKFLAEKSDLSYDWFTNYYQEEQGDRNSLKQDFTPDSLCKIVNLINGKADRIADICSGTGGLTIKVWNENPDAFFHCEEVASRAIPVLLFNLAIRGISGEIVHGNVLTREVEAIYKLTRNGKFSDIEQAEEVADWEYDSVIMNPPYSLKWNGISDERFAEFGAPPKSKADYCFVLHGLNMLSDEGRLLAILPHGVLFRGSSEGKIRQALIDKHYIRTIIGFPDNLFLNTSIPTLLLELKKGSTDTLIIDASKEFIKGKSVNSMSEENIETVLSAYKFRKRVDKLSYLATTEEIKKNDYNLNIPRYVDSFEAEELPDIGKLMSDMQKTAEDIRKLDFELFEFMKGLVGTTSEEDEKQRQVTKAFGKYIETKYGQIGIAL